MTAVFAGPLPDGARRRLCPRARRRRCATVDAPFDLVVSTNGGYPLDRNLYQAVKGMAAAERIVRDGGIVVMAAACEDGVPAGGAFARLLGRAPRPRPSSPARPAAPELDRWQAQVLGPGARPGRGPLPRRGPRAGRDRGRAARAGRPISTARWRRRWAASARGRGWP